MAAEHIGAALPAPLVRAIHEAFTSEPPAPSELFAAGSDDGDAAAIRRVIRGRRWTAVSRQLARVERSGLSWFADDARRHYLPLWLLAAGDDDLVRLWTVSHLQQVAESPREQAGVLGCFSPGELRVVAGFLAWVVEVQSDVRDLAAQALPWWQGVSEQATPRAG